MAESLVAHDVLLFDNELKYLHELLAELPDVTDMEDTSSSEYSPSSPASSLTSLNENNVHNLSPKDGNLKVNGEGNENVSKIIKRPAKINVSRKRMYTELANLRTQVKQLEQELADLSLSKSKQYNNKNFGLLSEDCGVLWREMAKRQEAAAQYAMHENAKLRHTLQYQIYLAQTLQALQHERSQWQLPLLSHPLQYRAAKFVRFQVDKLLPEHTTEYIIRHNLLQQSVVELPNVMARHGVNLMNSTSRLAEVDVNMVEKFLRLTGKVCSIVPASIDNVMDTVWTAYNLKPTEICPNDNIINEGYEQVIGDGMMYVLTKGEKLKASGTISAHRQRIDSNHGIIVFEFMGYFDFEDGEQMKIHETNWSSFETINNGYNEELQTNMRMCSYVRLQYLMHGVPQVIQNFDVHNLLTEYKNAQELVALHFETTLMEILTQT